MWQLATWAITGSAVGWLVRKTVRAGTGFGLAGHLVTGWLGGILAGWLLRRGGAVGSSPGLADVLVAGVGALLLIETVRFFRRFGRATTGTPPPTGMVTGLEERVRTLGKHERRILLALLSRERVTSDPNQRFEESLTVGQRLADRVARFGGSWTFIGLFGIVIVSWMALNEELGRPFDPYPYILLNLVLSCVAALQAPVIMMSQNRQAARDRTDARIDYEVNVKAEMEIMSLHGKVDLLREQEWAQLLSLVERQQESLAAIARRLDELGGGRE